MRIILSVTELRHVASKKTVVSSISGRITPSLVQRTLGSYSLSEKVKSLSSCMMSLAALRMPLTYMVIFSSW